MRVERDSLTYITCPLRPIWDVFFCMLVHSLLAEPQGIKPQSSSYLQCFLLPIYFFPLALLAFNHFHSSGGMYVCSPLKNVTQEVLSGHRWLTLFAMRHVFLFPFSTTGRCLDIQKKVALTKKCFHSPNPRALAHGFSL